jgi:hypothetical protein
VGEGHKSCDAIFLGDGEQRAEVKFGSVDEIHAAEIVREYISFALFMLELEGEGL